MKRVLALLLLVSCTRRETAAPVDAAVDTGPTASAGLGDLAKLKPAPTAPPPPAEPTIPVAADGGLAALLAGDASAARLPEAATQGDAGFDWGLRERLTTEYGEGPAVAGPKGRATIGTVTATTPISDAERVLAAMRPRFRQCYNTGLQSDPSMSGKVTIATKVKVNGEVSEANVTQNVGISEAVASCIARTHTRATFNASGAESVLTETVTLAVEK